MTPGIVLGICAVLGAVGVATAVVRARRSGPEPYVAPFRDRTALVAGAVVALYPLAGVRADPVGALLAAAVVGVAATTVTHEIRERLSRRT